MLPKQQKPRLRALVLNCQVQKFDGAHHSTKIAQILCASAKMTQCKNLDVLPRPLYSAKTKLSSEFFLIYPSSANLRKYRAKGPKLRNSAKSGQTRDKERQFETKRDSSR